MKVSEFIRQYQITGRVPEPKPAEDPMIAFWAGWLMGRANPFNKIEISAEDSLSTAITVAEFIEKHAKG